MEGRQPSSGTINSEGLSVCEEEEEWKGEERRGEGRGGGEGGGNEERKGREE